MLHDMLIGALGGGLVGLLILWGEARGRRK